MFQEKSFWNCHFFCSVVCGVFGFCADADLFGKIMYGSWLFAPIGCAKSAYWKMNSFNFDPPSTQLWFTLIELKRVFARAPPVRWRVSGAAPYGCELVFRP